MCYTSTSNHGFTICKYIYDTQTCEYNIRINDLYNYTIREMKVNFEMGAGVVECVRMGGLEM